MAASKEWYEYHLTPNGWVAGDERLDSHYRKGAEPPVNRVLTRRYKEIIRSVYGGIERSEYDTWTSDDTQKIEELLKQFPYPKSLSYWFK